MGHARDWRLWAFAGLIAILNTSPALAAEPAKGAMTPAAERLAYYRRVYLTEGYEKAGARDPKWDAKAREALEQYVKISADDPGRTGDEDDLCLAACGECQDVRCPDALVFYAGARLSTMAGLDEKGQIEFHLYAAARALKQKEYPPVVRSMILLRGASFVTRANRLRPQPEAMEYGKRLLAEGLEQLQAALADPEIPPSTAAFLFTLVGVASQDMEGDRLKLVTEAMRTAEKSPLSKSRQLTIAAQELKHYAWDARGGAWAGEVTKEGWKLFGERIAAARAGLEQAWKLDPTNAEAAAGMVDVARAQQLPRDEMERWYRRAVDLDPTLHEAIESKLEYLEPKWHGSREEMLAFGRELLRDGKWNDGQPMNLVAAHLRLAQYEEGADL
jgi:hypothetical protein